MTSHDIHSRHVDYLHAYHQAVAKSLAACGPARVEAAGHAVEVINELVRDDMCDLTMVVAGVDADAFDELDGRLCKDGSKQEILRTVAGQPIVTITYVRDGGES